MAGLFCYNSKLGTKRNTDLITRITSIHFGYVTILREPYASKPCAKVLQELILRLAAPNAAPWKCRGKTRGPNSAQTPIFRWKPSCDAKRVTSSVKQQATSVFTAERCSTSQEVSCCTHQFHPLLNKYNLLSAAQFVLGPFGHPRPPASRSAQPEVRKDWRLLQGQTFGVYEVMANWNYLFRLRLYRATSPSSTTCNRSYKFELQIHKMWKSSCFCESSLVFTLFDALNKSGPP